MPSKRQGVLIVVGVIVFLIVTIALLIRFLGDEKKDSAVLKAETTVAAAAPVVAGEAMKQVEKYSETRIEIRDRVVASNAAIQQAEGASVTIPSGVADAGIRALCMSALYSSHPRCAPVLDLHPEGLVDGDTGR